MELLGARIKFNPRPARQITPALEVAMLGHSPGAVRLERFFALTDAVREIRALGYGRRLDLLLQGDNDTISREGMPSQLHHLPIPLRSWAEFDDIFPEASSAPSQYKSLLAGERAWLGQAVQDFFSNGGEKCWVVLIPEAEGRQGFLPPLFSPLIDPEQLRGLACVLILNDVGLLALPDLERLQIAAKLPDIPRLRLANPQPEFIPCGSSINDDHRERRLSSELPFDTEPLPFLSMARTILDLIAKHRPDLQCLLTLPLRYSQSLASPVIDPLAITQLNDVVGSEGAHRLRQMQLLFPYLRSAELGLHSPTGVIAGAIAKSALDNGVWRSIAGKPLASSAQTFPPLTSQQITALRESPGIGALHWRPGKLQLDDERLVVPALHANDYNHTLSSEFSRGARAAEVVRFLGYLIRQLRALGERLIFNVDPADPRPRLLLEKFFTNLFEAGALRGNVPEQAFTIRESVAQENVIGFDIEIAPAFPIDKLVLTFVNRDGLWLVQSAKASGTTRPVGVALG